MVCLTLNGVPIEFPFQPYDVQEKFMEKVLECLQKGSNGLLESPTGTGKTLCLLCSCLGWLASRKAQIQAGNLVDAGMGLDLKNQLSMATGWGDGPAGQADGRVPKIIYASRTHSQLSQVISELKRSSYKYVKVSILGSRDQLCIHPEVSKETNNATKLHMCHARTTTRSCYFYTNLDHKKEDPDFKVDILDIEDLVRVGKKHSACPYFMTKEIRKHADIIFMPYNYLLDPKVRKIHNIELAGNIIIFDEAHNVEKMCEESASIELRSLDLALCVDEVTYVMKKFREGTGGADDSMSFESLTAGAPKDFTVDDLCILKAMFLELEKAIDAIKISKPEGDTLPGQFMLEILAKADLTPGKKDVILDLLDKVVQYLTVASTSPYQRKGNGLQKFADLVKIVFSRSHFSAEHMDRVKKSYKVHIKIEQTKSKKDGGGDPWGASSSKVNAKAGRVLSYWCFSPGFGMRDLVEEGARCLILTSGTLSPLSTFAAELQIPFPVTLENPHIIGSNQVLVGVVTHGPDGTELDSSFKNRTNEKYLSSLGRTIRSVAQIVPDGLLVFFPSYPVMKSCQESWQLSGIWDALNQVKPIFVEPNSKEGFLAVMSGYYGAVANPDRRGAIFMAVCRGKVSEGLDFCDGNGRAVIITGLPFPPSRDPRVIEKQKYLEDNRKDPLLQGLTGQQWYRLEATRAVNQAIGRVIRHRLDYGSILLCDQRFSSPALVQQLSAWVRPRLSTFPKIGPLLRDLGMFFRNAEILFPGSDRPARTPILPSPDALSADKKILTSVDSFSHALSSSSSSNKNPVRNPSAPAANPRMSIGTVDLAAYSGASAKRPINSEGQSIFEASKANPSNQYIDFNEVDLTSATGSGRADAENPSLPAQKKRKLLIVSDAQKAKIERRKLEEAVTEGPNALNSSTLNPDSRKEKAANYLKSVKGSLDASSYAAFSAMTSKYRKDKDVEALLESLAKIFLGRSGALRHLFRDYRQFVNKEHAFRFDNECSKHQIM